jgi:hypothetical protein
VPVGATRRRRGSAGPCCAPMAIVSRVWTLAVFGRATVSTPFKVSVEPEGQEGQEAARRALSAT